MKIHVLASGSKGNATLVEDGENRLLVDAGLSARELTKRLESEKVGCSPKQLQGILLTHAHGDHVRGVRVFATKYALPVFATEQTFEGLGPEVVNDLRPLWTKIRARPAIAGPDPDCQIPRCGIVIHPIQTSHDKDGSVGYVFTSACGTYKAAVMTDLGEDGGILKAIRGCNLLVLEFNHDLAMLWDKEKCDYPHEVKKRIQGPRGHLSNDQARDILVHLLQPGPERRLEALVLAHLSEKSNTPQLALAAADAALGFYKLQGRVDLIVAGPAEPVTIPVPR